MNAQTRIKICGITRREDAEAAWTAGADALGFLFYPGSPRYITPAAAAAMAMDLPPFLTLVGLFVNASHADILQTVALGFLNSIQLHGDESPAYCQHLRDQTGGGVRTPSIIKAIRVATAQDLHALSQWPVQAILLDAKVGSQYGGTGKSFDWSLLHPWPSLFPTKAAPLPMVLAGGLTPDTVGRAVRQVRPYAVDVSSGVEQSPGIKCADKINSFIQQVRQADQDQASCPNHTPDRF